MTRLKLCLIDPSLVTQAGKAGNGESEPAEKGRQG